MINWAFWKSPNAQLDSVLDPAAPASPSTGKLFGISLPDLCENDSLPTPIMVSLVLSFDPNKKENSGKGELWGRWGGNLFPNGNYEYPQVGRGALLTERMHPQKDTKPNGAIEEF